MGHMYISGHWMHICVEIYTEARGQCWLSFSIVQELYLYFLSQSCPLIVEITDRTPGWPVKSSYHPVHTPFIILNEKAHLLGFGRMAQWILQGTQVGFPTLQLDTSHVPVTLATKVSSTLFWPPKTPLLMCPY